MTPQIGEPAPYICYACANGRHSDCQEEACECSHRAQPSRPAVPDCWNEGQPHDFVGGKCLRCGKPELDAQFERGVEYLHRKVASDETLASDLIEQLQRQLSLAQTEIKGHMRVEDDLRADLAAEAPARFQLQAALGRAQDKWQEAQSRIAELEKALAGARKHIESRGAFTPHSVAIAAIDVALKDRA